MVNITDVPIDDDPHVFMMKGNHSGHSDQQSNKVNQELDELKKQNERMLQEIHELKR